jgi:pimeloyl-ACP methyl ester carboxylesterase/DNA-binding winged helix-turn-helix (wHTH) protein
MLGDAVETSGRAGGDAPIYAFGEYELDTRLQELRHAGRPVHVEPQTFQVLAHLLAHRDRVVTKDELLDDIWGHRFIAPTTLSTRIKQARQAVGDDGATQAVIRTVRGRGFRIVADVEQRGGRPAVGESDASETSAGPAGKARPADAPKLDQTIRFAQAPDGVRIAYATSGSGPVLVKTANWLTHLEHDWESPVWRHWLRELSGDHTLVRYDERGCGLSDWEARDVSFDTWIRDLETVVDELGLERFPLFGMSQGCAVAVAYAARHPTKVTHLVLFGGYVLGRLHRARTDEEREEAEALIRVMPYGWGRDNPAFRQFFANIFLPGGTPEQMSWFSDLQRTSTTPPNAVRLRTTSANIDVVELAKRVSAPTLILHATGDAAVPFAQGRELATLIPGAQLVPLDSRNHILLEDEPAWARFQEEVRSFLGTRKSP